MGVFTQPACGSGPSSNPVPASTLDAEVSTAAVAAQTYSGFGPTEGPFRSFSESTVGFAEGAPVWVVTVQTDGASVARVKVTFADGATDQMVPVAGWTVLAHVVPKKWATGTTSAIGTIDAEDGAGKSIAGVGFQAPGVISASPTTLVYPQPNVTLTTLPGASVGGAPLPAQPPSSTSSVLASPPPSTLPATVPPPKSCATAVPPSPPRRPRRANAPLAS